jgi:ubiquinol-cytochrome c reductase core subunit 2
VTLNSKASTYYGGEQRTSHTGGNALVLAFPGSSFGTFKPEIAVLAALLGGQPNVKWSPGFTILSKATAAAPGATASATNLAYSDAGLLTVQINGAATSVRKTAEEAVKALKSIAQGSTSKEDLTKALAKAKFDALEASQSGVSTFLSAGSGIVQTGKPFQIAETVQLIDGVTAEKLEAVSFISLNILQSNYLLTIMCQAAKSILDGKATVATVGDLHVLPYAEELGLKV